MPISSFEIKDMKDATSKLSELLKLFQENVDDSINLSKLTSISQSLTGCPLVSRDVSLLYSQFPVGRLGQSQSQIFT